MAVSHEERESIKKQLAEAKLDASIKRAAFQNDLEGVYHDAPTAYVGIMRMWAKAGEGAVLQRLERDPNYFGSSHGALGTMSFFKPGASDDRALAKELLHGMGGRAKAVFAAENRVADLQRALHGPDLAEVYADRQRERGGPSR